MNKGHEQGELCNRNGCQSTIKEEEKDGACSCHINPPCSYCTTQTGYCDGCGWRAEDEVIESKVIKNPSRNYADSYMERNRLIQEKIKTGKGITKFELFYKGHTHFSMKVIGVYPSQMSKYEVLNKVKGTFGGRFTKFNDHSFEYVAYTD